MTIFHPENNSQTMQGIGLDARIHAAYLDAFAQHNLRVQQFAVSTCALYAPSILPITTTCAYCRSHIAAGPTNCPNCGAAL